MRFLGNKTTILPEIESILEEKKILREDLSFFDAFCGTGSVADYFKQYYSIIVNDNLNWAVTYSKGRICAHSCSFNKLPSDPFDLLNTDSTSLQGFFYKNYSPGESDRRYFTKENAGRIDFFRWQIEQWKKNELLTENEYCYLLACLIESVSDVSNTAGVYGAYLKKWDSRALKPICFNKVDSAEGISREFISYSSRIEDIIDKVDCDILYLDPPYTQNQYGTQYHLLETLVLYDNPEISKVTGSRPTSPMRSDWSKDIKCHILFDKIIAKTKAKYILFSYNNDGFMSKEFIEATLKRYGKENTYVCRKIPYKKYQNWKSCNEDTHFEYLFYIEKKPENEVIYESPLNYTGSKAKVVSTIRKHSDVQSPHFFDLFGGGFNVGVNMPNAKVRYIDINCYVTGLIASFKKIDTYEYISYVKKQIQNYGLEKANGKAYLKARAYYNSLPIDRRDPRLLFTIILYGYQQQIRFNGSHEFNNPVGMRWFNDKVLEKVICFSRRIKEIDCEFITGTYLDIEDEINIDDFVYMDPPYELTTGAYNDGKRGFKGWGKAQEAELFAFIERISGRGIHFMLSYVAEHKGRTNKELLDWINKNHFHLTELGDILGISGSRRKEVIITNYGIL